MRPIERGPDPGPFTDYKDARDPLIQRIGDYCSYCENVLPSEVDVEHMQPKSRPPYAALVWTNFLLACSYCNSVKGDRLIVISDHLWPDLDNTFLAFYYAVDEPPSVAGRLPDTLQVLAQRTLELTGLDRCPGHPRLSPRDRRWLKRKQVWGIALLSLTELQSTDTPQMRRQIALTAASRGFFSIWMTVFQHDADMRKRIILSFSGTAGSCFDADGNPIPRPGGRV